MANNVDCQCPHCGKTIPVDASEGGPGCFYDDTECWHCDKPIRIVTEMTVDAWIEVPPPDAKEAQ